MYTGLQLVGRGAAGAERSGLGSGRGSAVRLQIFVCRPATRARCVSRTFGTSTTSSCCSMSSTSPPVEPCNCPLVRGRKKTLNAKVLGISTNHGASQKVFTQQLKLDYPLLSAFAAPR